MDNNGSTIQATESPLITAQASITDAKLRLTQISTEILGTALRPPQRVSQVGIQVLRRPVLVYTMSGGISMGGNATTLVRLSWSATGGLSIGSTVTPATSGFTHTMSGGVKLKGYCDTSTIHGSTLYSLNGGSNVAGGTYIPTQVLLGGQAGIRVTRAITSTPGGPVMGGAADAHIAFFHVMSGGVTMGGRGGVRANYAVSMRGGVTTGGRSTQRVAIGFSMRGGVTTGAPNVKLGNGYISTMGGGVTVGGTASCLPGLKFTSRGGGVTTGGTGDFQFNLAYTMKGGISMGGQIGNPPFALGYVSSGGIAMGGQSKTIWGNAFTMSGGIAMGGQAGKDGLNAGYNYIPEFPNNRIFVYGKGSYGSDSYNYTMTGGIRIVGSATVNVCVLACDTSLPYYRDVEALAGCQVLLPNGKLDYLCARPILYYPQDGVRDGAIVPAATVCRQALYKTTKKDRNCDQFIRK